VAPRAWEEAEAAHAGRRVKVASREAVYGEWDPDRVGQALANLVGNAIDAATAGTTAPRVEVRLDALDGAATLRVTDSGAEGRPRDDSGTERRRRHDDSGKVPDVAPRPSGRNSRGSHAVAVRRSAAAARARSVRGFGISQRGLHACSGPVCMTPLCMTRGHDPRQGRERSCHSTPTRRVLGSTSPRSLGDSRYASPT